MKKILTLFIMAIFLVSVMPLSIAKEYTKGQITQKKEALKEITLNLKEYIQSTKDKIEVSKLIPETEKVIIIKKLDEKSTKIDEYDSRIEDIESIEEVNAIKTELKVDIKEIKPVVEKPIIKIQKDKISKVISKLKAISKKLGVAIAILDDSEKDKIKELKNLIDSASNKLNKAEKLSNKDASNSEEIRSLLNEATVEIKQAFELVRELLSQLESNVLNDLEIYEPEKQDKTIKSEKTKEDYSYCNYIITWYNENGNLIRKKDYNSAEDKCNGFRSISGKEISPSCYNKEECNDLNLKCVNVKELKENCKLTADSDEVIKNIYVNLNEVFKLGVGQSAKMIYEIRNGDNTTTKESIIITLKNLYEKRAGTNINYWIENDHIKNSYDILNESNQILIGDYYVVELLKIEENEAVYVIKKGYYGKSKSKKNVEKPLYEIVTIVLATGDTVYNVKLLSVDNNGKLCTIEYQRNIYAINKESAKTMPDGKIIKVKKVIPTEYGILPDYCEIEIKG